MAGSYGQISVWRSPMVRRFWGARADAGIRFDLPGVSRRHARITAAAEHVMLEDLESRNGTFRDGEKISGPVELADGSEIGLGPVRITFRLVSPESSTCLL